MRKILTFFIALFVVCGCATTSLADEDYKKEALETVSTELVLIKRLNHVTRSEDIASVNIDREGTEKQEPECDYYELMIEYCITGNETDGKHAEELRNQKIDSKCPDVQKVSFSDLFLLSKIIMSEAGSDWLSISWKMSVGEVLLNRVDSVEFPNTLKECVYQDGQYNGVNNRYFEELFPNRESVESAAKLLSGERVLNEKSVVFQSNFKQGSGVFLTLHDDLLGYTYFCYSSYPELYEGEA